MIALTRLSPQLCDSVLRRTQNNLRKFANLGIDSRPDVISLENVEYLSKLLAIEAVLPGYQRSAHDREIFMRVCEQFQQSGISGLRDWAIAQLNKDKEELEKQIQNCKAAISEMLDRLALLKGRDLDPEDFMTQEEWEAQYENAPLSEQFDFTLRKVLTGHW